MLLENKPNMAQRMVVSVSIVRFWAPRDKVEQWLVGSGGRLCSISAQLSSTNSLKV